MSRARFESMVAVGEFLEWADVFGNLYGTCASDTEQLLAGGADVVLVIDVQGARQVRRSVPGALLVFLAPPSREELARRLTGRGTEPPEVVRHRLAVAREEAGGVVVGVNGNADLMEIVGTL